jgi:hypothetical protein
MPTPKPRAVRGQDGEEVAMRMRDDHHTMERMMTMMDKATLRMGGVGAET